MLSYQGSETVKAEFAARFAKHRELDQVIQGTGFEADTQRGCFIGCTMHTYSHEAFANQIGPQWLAHLADVIFEGLPKIEAPQFGTDLLVAIPVGKDLDKVQYLLAAARHKRQIERLVGNLEPYAEQCTQALQSVITYCEGRANGIFDEEAARLFAEIATARRNIGRPIGQFDAQIAAIARAEGAAIATRDLSDFTDCGIELINPWE